MTPVTPLQRFRFDAGLSRRELAARAAVSHETIRQIEQGGRFGVGIAGKLAETLDGLLEQDIRPSDLLSPVEQPESGAAA